MHSDFPGVPQAFLKVSCYILSQGGCKPEIKEIDDSKRIFVSPEPRVSFILCISAHTLEIVDDKGAKYSREIAFGLEVEGRQKISKFITGGNMAKSLCMEVQGPLLNSQICVRVYASRTHVLSTLFFDYKKLKHNPMQSTWQNLYGRPHKHTYEPAII